MKTVSTVRHPLELIVTSRLHRLSPRQMDFLERYEAACPRPRDRFLWGWVAHALDATVLPGVDLEFEEDARVAKFLCTVLDVTLDDVADGGASPAEVAAMCDAVFGSGPVEEVAPWLRSSTECAIDLRRAIGDLVQWLPGFSKFEDFLLFDFAQLAGAMRYASLVNKMPSAGNVLENRAYQCHNMHMVVSGTIDLMARRSFDVADLGAVRALLYTGQLMGRIGNSVSTWPREVEQRDFSSCFFSVLAEELETPVSDLAALSPQAIFDLEECGQAEAAMLADWADHRISAVALAARIRSFPASRYVSGLDELLELHMTSRGLK